MTTDKPFSLPKHIHNIQRYFFCCVTALFYPLPYINIYYNMELKNLQTHTWDKTQNRACVWEIFTAVKIHVGALWAVTLYGVAVGYQRFGGPWCLHLQVEECVCVYVCVCARARARPAPSRKQRASLAASDAFHFLYRQGLLAPPSCFRLQRHVRHTASYLHSPPSKPFPCWRWLDFSQVLRYL
jgi:hypothetical protein